jgi:hypothetical protein
MKIRDVQRDAFTAHRAETFPLRVRALLASQLPEEKKTLETDAGLRRVEAEIARARAIGFASEHDVVIFTALSFVLGPKFADERWARDVLDDPGHASATDRAEALWDAAQRRELDAFVHESTAAHR